MLLKLFESIKKEENIPVLYYDFLQHNAGETGGGVVGGYRWNNTYLEWTTMQVRW